jgi:hypothetical protein
MGRGIREWRRLHGEATLQTIGCAVAATQGGVQLLNIIG